MTDSYVELQDTPSGQLAEQFAQALADQDFEQAATFIAEGSQSNYSVTKLQQTYLAMIDYGDSSTVYQVEALECLDDWPTKQSTDMVWIYVSIEGDGFGEAVAVVITQDQKIRDIEWGRP